MAKLTKLFKVDDVEYQLTQLGGVEGLDLFDRLTGELGPAIMNALVGAMASKDPEAALGFVIAGALLKLPPEFKLQLRVRFAGLSKVKSDTLLLDLGDGTKLDPNGVFDQHFAGRFGHMQKWLIASLKWSFGDFLPSSLSSDAKPPPPTTSA